LEVHDQLLGKIAKGGVVAKFRNDGLKLAHILDAAKDLDAKDIVDYKMRFLRSMNPANCFPFPSSRRFEFEHFEDKSDPAEDPKIQMIMASFMAEYLGFEEFKVIWESLGGKVSQLNDWREEAKKIQIKYAIRNKSAAKSKGPSKKVSASPTTSICTSEVGQRETKFTTLHDFMDSNYSGIALIYRNSEGIYDNDDFLTWEPSRTAWGMARNTKFSLELEGIERKLFLMDLDGLCQGIYYCEDPDDFRTSVSVLQVVSFVTEVNLRVPGAASGRHISKKEFDDLIRNESIAF
jgi:hypothetical protein